MAEVSWVEVSVAVTRQAAAIAELALEAIGALAVTLEDDADHPVLEPGPGETPLWVKVYNHENELVQEIRRD